jgi:hypothetical protein
VTAWRVILAAPAVAALAYAATLLADVPEEDWVSVLQWLAGGVLLHDGVLAPIVVGLGLVASRWLPAAWRAPAVVGLVCWGSLSLLAIPVLSGNGVDPTNETLQDRPYVTSWWIGMAVTLVLVVAVGWWRHRPRTSGGRTR